MILLSPGKAHCPSKWGEWWGVGHMCTVPVPNEPMWRAVMLAWMLAAGMLSLQWSCPVACPGCCRLLQQTYTSGWVPGPPPSAHTHQILLVPGNRQKSGLISLALIRWQKCVLLERTLLCERDKQYQISSSWQAAVSKADFPVNALSCSTAELVPAHLERNNSWKKSIGTWKV